jgi:hypothetical protein
MGGEHQHFHPPFQLIDGLKKRAGGREMWEGPFLPSAPIFLTYVKIKNVLQVENCPKRN